jgi:hypothetical protein
MATEIKTRISLLSSYNIKTGIFILPCRVMCYFTLQKGLPQNVSAPVSVSYTALGKLVIISGNRF